jgi:hypothetical protein
MFVRFRHTEPWLQLSLVEINGDGDTARQEDVASLGTIPIESSAADRAAFWEQLIRRLASLGERVDYEAIIAAVAARVPPVTDRERDAIPPPKARPEAKVPTDHPAVLGIGFGGALALYRGPGDWTVIDAPTRGRGKQRELDAAAFAAWLREHRPMKAFFEHGAGLPAQGRNTKFGHAGMSWGLKAALAAFAVPCVEVTEAEWRQAVGIEPGSDMAPLQMALRRWPDQARHLRRKHDERRAKAMLIAAYGMDLVSSQGCQARSWV